MRSKRGPGVFPATLPEQLTHILTSINVDMEGNPADPFIDDDWRLQACQFVDGDPSRLEVIFTGILGGRLRLTVSAKKLGQGWFEAGEIWGDGDPALTPIANPGEPHRLQLFATPSGDSLCLPIDNLTRRHID